jgi:hypothetical protein
MTFMTIDADEKDKTMYTNTAVKKLKNSDIPTFVRLGSGSASASKRCTSTTLKFSSFKSRVYLVPM